VLRTGNVASFASLVNPSLSSADVPSTATYRDLAGARAILAAGTAMDEEHFVADLMVKAAVRGGGKLVYVHPEENRVSRFAEVFLRCRPGTQAQVVAAVAGLPGAPSPEAVAERAGVDAGDVREAAAILGGAGDKVVVFNRDFRGERTRGDARVYAAAARALGAGLLGLHEKANGQGIVDVGATPADAAVAEALAERVRGKGIRVAVLLGEDPLGASGVPEDLKAGLRAAGLVIAADVIETATTRAAHVVLPLSAAAETSGTMTNSERRVQRLGQAVPPVAGVETWQLLCRLGARLGNKAEWKARSTADVFTWLQCAVPAYRDVVVDGAGRDGLTYAPAPAPAVPDVASALDGTVTPAATLEIDCLEAGFAAWFDGEMGRARRRHAAAAETSAVATAAGGGEP
jgi:predicted molibdopterin-dependent oxidoreductase YjgC